MFSEYVLVADAMVGTFTKAASKYLSSLFASQKVLFSSRQTILISMKKILKQTYSWVISFYITQDQKNTLMMRKTPKQAMTSPTILLIKKITSGVRICLIFPAK